MNINDFEKAMELTDDRFIGEAADFTGSRKTFFTPKKAALVLAAVFAVFVLSVTGLAASGSGPASDILYELFPAAAQALRPVRMSCESGGITAEVIGADVTGSRALIYAAVRGTEERPLDDTADLFDSYTIRTPRDMTGTCAFTEYDAGSGEARFLITMETMNGEPIEKGKVTFSFTKILTGKKTSSLRLSLASEDIPAAPATKECATDGVGNRRTVLAENTALPAGPAEGAAFSAAGYIDGRLHVQTRFADVSTYDNHGFAALTDKDGKSADCIDTVIFDSDDGAYRYYESVYDIAPGEAENYTLSAEFVTCDTLYTGDWTVTFPLG